MTCMKQLDGIKYGFYVVGINFYYLYTEYTDGIRKIDALRKIQR